MREIVVLVLLILTVHQTTGSEAECEKEENHNYINFLLFPQARTCYMKTVTTISSPGFTISSRDETIGGLLFDHNKKINFLPEKVANTFPNLIVYSVYNCSLVKVFPANFKNLVNLKALDLQNNKIEKIPNNLFDDLTSLEYLNLSKEFFNSCGMSRCPG